VQGDRRFATGRRSSTTLSQARGDDELRAVADRPVGGLPTGTHRRSDTTVPTYAFRCPACGDFDARFPMTSIPTQLDCRTCGGGARRIFSAPHLGLGSSTAVKLLDATERTASEPAVVASLPDRRTPPRPVTRNPLHAKLPRP
jgi:putative FmdB family regulatory protein